MTDIVSDVANPLFQAMTNAGQTQADQPTTPSATPSALTPPAPPPGNSPPAFLSGQTLPTAPTHAPGSFAQKMAQAAQKIGIMPGPGGALKTIAASAVDALSGLQDAATGPVTPGGSGALEGITQTLQNRRSRLNAQAEQQQKQTQQQFENNRQDMLAKASIAHENAATVHEQALTAQLGFENSQKMVSDQKGIYDTFVGQGAPVITKDKTAAEAKTLLAQEKLDPTMQHIFPTGTKEVGKDANGQPEFETTYSVVGDIPEYQFDKTTADYVNKTHPGMDVQEKQRMAGYQAGQLIQQSNTSAAAMSARDQFLKTYGDADAAEAAKKEVTDFGPKWTQALAKAGIDRPDLAARSIMNDPQFMKDHPNFMSDVIANYGGRESWDAAMKNVSEEKIAQIKQAGENADKIGAVMTDDMKGQIASLAPDKLKLIKQYNPDVQATMYSLAFGPGDLDFDKVFPNRRYKGSQDLSAQQAIGVIKQLNPNWSEQQYKQTAKMYTDITTGKMGNSIAQYNNVLQHGAEAQDIIESGLRKDNPRFLNSAINLAENQGWGTQASAIGASLQPVKEEYATLLANGYKPSESEQKAYDQMFNPAATPAQIETALKVVGAVGSIRLENINQQYKRLAGKNIPGILTTDSLQAAKHLNLDQSAQQRLGQLNVGDTLFHNSNWKPSDNAQLEQQNKNEQDNVAQRQATAATVVPPDAKGQLSDGTKVVGYVDASGKQVLFNMGAK